MPAGYTFDYYTENGESFTGNSFIMPDYNVTIGMVYQVDGWTGNRSISGYTNSKNGYILIASPVGTVSPEDVTYMLDNDYDLYTFDQAEELEWRNYEASHFDLKPGKGYLYANSGDVTLTFTGNPYVGNGEVVLSKTDNADAEFQGWNLVGNPYAVTAYIEDGRSFYIMNPDGNEIMPAETNAIAPMEGMFVIANTDGETMTFTTTEPENNGKGRGLALNLSRANRGGASTVVIDRAIVRFGEGQQNRNLPKFQINRNSTKVYIPQDGKDYAVVNAGRDGAYTVSTANMPAGVYVLRLINGDKVKTQKIVIK